MLTDLKYWYLREHKLFRNLSFSEINALCILKKFNKSKKNQVITLPFSTKERVYFLKKGTIKLVKINDNGDELLIDILQKGDLFGDLNLEKTSDQPEFFKVVSEEAIICTFFKENLENLMLKKPDFALHYIKFIGFKHKIIKNRYENILFRDAKHRLLLLLNTIIEKECPQKSTFILPNYLNQKDMAQLICSSRQTIVSLLKELKQEGILHYSQKEIVVQDIESIKKILNNVK